MWIDPITEKKHKCPEWFGNALMKVLGLGAANSKVCRILLAEMGLPNTNKHARWLRHACLIFKHTGIPAISIRSGKGGYFIAQTEAEIEAYFDAQIKAAQAMIVGAQLLKSSFTAQVRQARLF